MFISPTCTCTYTQRSEFNSTLVLINLSITTLTANSLVQVIYFKDNTAAITASEELKRLAQHQVGLCFLLAKK